jgi:uncharacterized protein YdeI (YjbR/CyaY-like superfamily)
MGGKVLTPIRENHKVSEREGVLFAESPREKGMDVTAKVSPASRTSWREWLKKNHRRKREIWLVFPKKHTGRRSVSYEEAVEEAICFGWIDSIVKKIDGERYAQKFTPRGKKTSWSPTNIRRAEKMIREKRMTRTGLEKFKGAEEKAAAASGKRLALSSEFLGVLQANSRALQNYFKLPPSHRRQYSGWVMSAKREETRLRRLREMIGVLEKGKRLGMK